MTPSITPARRREWLSVLAHAPRDALARHASAIADRGFETLREPETGLAMLRGRIGNRGDRFNLGEATMTRCVVRHRGAGGSTSAGVGYVLGRDAERALWIARLDALLQQGEHHADLMRDVIAPLRERIAARRADETARTAASRVRFFTLQPEAAA
jgi:alpha-D-ribose 1-methylphosphonate 5-triphosphate synthase subunit PhnG